MVAPDFTGYFITHTTSTECCGSKACGGAGALHDALTCSKSPMRYVLPHSLIQVCVLPPAPLSLEALQRMPATEIATRTRAIDVKQAHAHSQGRQRLEMIHMMRQMRDRDKIRKTPACSGSRCCHGDSTAGSPRSGACLDF